MSGALLTVAGALAISLALVRFYPEWTERQFSRIQMSREVIFGIFGLITALAFIASGVAILQLVGFILLLYGTLWFAFERPDKTVRRAL
jgi:uncharacterized membrane protein YidH (DUF202 family)